MVIQRVEWNCRKLSQGKDEHTSLHNKSMLNVLPPARRLTLAELGSPANLRWLGEGGANIVPPPRLTSEPRGRARSARRRSKALNKGILKSNHKIFLARSNFGSWSGQRSSKADSFRLIGCRNRTRDSCKRKLYENATEGMTKMPCK